MRISDWGSDVCSSDLLDSATDGRALYDGTNIASLPARRRPEALIRVLQIVFQNPDGTLNPSHRVHRILARALKRPGHRDRHAVNARLPELLNLRSEERLVGQAGVRTRGTTWAAYPTTK